MEKRGEEETGEQAQKMDCAEESPKGETGEGGIKEEGEIEERGYCGNVECANPGCKGKEWPHRKMKRQRRPHLSLGDYM